MMADVEQIQIVVAHSERATLRVGDMLLKIDTDPGTHRCRGSGDGHGTGAHSGDSVAETARARACRPSGPGTRPPAGAVDRVARGWAAAGASIRTLHDAPLPPRPGRSLDELASRLADECDWLVANDVVPVDVVTRNRRLAETVLRPWTEVFIHGDLQITHVFVEDDEVTGII